MLPEFVEIVPVGVLEHIERQNSRGWDLRRNAETRRRNNI